MAHTKSFDLLSGRKYYIKKGRKVRLNIPDYDLNLNPMLRRYNGLHYTVKRVDRLEREDGTFYGDMYLLADSEGKILRSKKGKPYWFIRNWLETVSENETV